MQGTQQWKGFTNVCSGWLEQSFYLGEIIDKAVTQDTTVLQCHDR
jgi:hypothetical protein